LIITHFVLLYNIDILNKNQFFIMKMMFSTNKKQKIFRPLVKEQFNGNNNDNINSINSKNTIEKKELINAVSNSFRYGMLARMTNTSNCSSCGK